MQTGMQMSAALAPYSKHKPPDPQDFIPVDSLTPQHPTQVVDNLKALAAALNQKNDG
jgi:hypothetical protein